MIQHKVAPDLGGPGGGGGFVTWCAQCDINPPRGSACVRMLSACAPVLVAVVVCMLLLAAALLLHHKSKHSDPTNAANYLPSPQDQWFQCSDVCNFHSCSHEMWILSALLVAIICTLVLVTTCMTT